MSRKKTVLSMMLYMGLMILIMTACNAQTTGANYHIKRDGQWTTIDNDILISTGEPHDTNLILVISGKEATLIDTGNGGENSLRVKAYIEKNDIVIKNIFLTHLDKADHLKLFKGKDTNVISPMRAENNQIIEMGDKVFKILTTPGYGDNKHMSIELNQSILFAGDIITASETMPRILTHHNIAPAIKTLEDIKAENYKLIIPAHGPIIENNSFVGEYLNKLKERTLKAEIKKEDQLTLVNGDIIVSTGSYEKVNMVLVVSGEEATLIDVGNDKGEALAIQKYIQKNKLKLKNIFITHEHQDHINNLDMFLERDVKVYKYEDLQNNNQVINMGDKTFRMRATPGHFNDRHMSIEINDNILIAGDILSTNIAPEKFLQFGGTKDTLIRTLEEMNQNSYTLIIPGHGDICIGKEIIQEHLDRLRFVE